MCLNEDFVSWMCEKIPALILWNYINTVVMVGDGTDAFLKWKYIYLHDRLGSKLEIYGGKAYIWQGVNY